MSSLLSNLCESISVLSNDIQEVAIINRFGRAEEKTIRIDSDQSTLDHNDEMLLMQCVLQVSMGREFDYKYGPINYHLSQRDNVTMLTFPLGDYVILVTTKKKVSPITLARKIVDVLESNKKNESIHVMS